MLKHKIGFDCNSVILVCNDRMTEFVIYSIHNFEQKWGARIVEN